MWCGVVQEIKSEASVCLDNRESCRTETEVADQSFSLCPVTVY